MSVATLTSKGQITLPKDVRDQLNLKAGDQLRFEAGADGTLIGRPAARSAEQLIGMLRTKTRKPVSIEKMDQSVARLLRQKHAVPRRVRGKAASNR